MLTIKGLYHKPDGRQFIQMVIASTAGTYTEDSIYLRLADYIASVLFSDYQSFYAVHKDTAHRHIHIVINTVNFRTGLKFSQSKQDLNRLKQQCNHWLTEFGFDIVKTSANTFWEKNDYSHASNFYFLELDESILPVEKNSVEIDPEDDPLEADTHLYSAPSPDPYVPECNDYESEAYLMNNFIPPISAFGVHTPECFNRLPVSTSMTPSSVNVPETLQNANAPGTVSSYFPTMGVSTGAKITIHTNDIEKAMPFIEKVAASASTQMVEAANISWAMFKKAQESGYPANTFVSTAPIIDIDLTGQFMNNIPDTGIETVLDFPDRKE